MCRCVLVACVSAVPALVAAQRRGRAWPGGIQFGCERLRLRGRTVVVNHELRAGGVQFAGNDRTDAPCRAGNQHYLVLQRLIHAVSL